MARSITQRELPTDSSEILRGLDRDEESVATRDWAPVVELLDVVGV